MLCILRKQTDASSMTTFIVFNYFFGTKTFNFRDRQARRPFERVRVQLSLRIAESNEAQPIRMLSFDSIHSFQVTLLTKEYKELKLLKMQNAKTIFV